MDDSSSLVRPRLDEIDQEYSEGTGDLINRSMIGITRVTIIKTCGDYQNGTRTLPNFWKAQILNHK